MAYSTINSLNTQSSLTFEKLRDSIFQYKKEETQWFWDQVLSEHSVGNTLCVGHEEVIQLFEKEFGLLKDFRPQWLHVSQYVEKTGLIFMQCVCLCHEQQVFIPRFCCTCSGRTVV